MPNGKVVFEGWARWLHAVQAKQSGVISFTASEREEVTVRIDADYVQAQRADIARDNDLCKYVL